MTPGGGVDVGPCVSAETASRADLEAAVSDQPGMPPALARVQARAVVCARHTGDSGVRVAAEQQYFDWQHGATGWKFRDRTVGEWPLGAIAGGHRIRPI